MSQNWAICIGINRYDNLHPLNMRNAMPRRCATFSKRKPVSTRSIFFAEHAPPKAIRDLFAAGLAPHLKRAGDCAGRPKPNSSLIGGKLHRPGLLLSPTVLSDDDNRIAGASG
jgi:hypothetical protein